MKFSEDEFFIRVWVHQCYTSQLLEVKQSFTSNLLGTTSLNYRYVRPTHTHTQHLRPLELMTYFAFLYYSNDLNF